MRGGTQGRSGGCVKRKVSASTTNRTPNTQLLSPYRSFRYSGEWLIQTPLVKESGVVNVDQLKEGERGWVNSIGWRGETYIQFCSRNT